MNEIMERELQTLRGLSPSRGNAGGQSYGSSQVPSPRALAVGQSHGGRRQLKDLLRESQDEAKRDDEHVVLEVTVRNDQVTLTSISQPGGGTLDRSFMVEVLERRNSLNSTRTPNVLEEARRVSRNGSSGARVTPLAYSPERSDDDSAQACRMSRKSSAHTPGILRTVSGAEYALEGLRNISKATGYTSDNDALWDAVDSRFEKLASSNNLLSRADFAACIGMKDSEEFAGELLDALTRRKGLHYQVETISKSELREYWRQITDKTFDSRMQLFFDLCDKDLDGHIREVEVREMIFLSAQANKLLILEEQAEEYAALIMGELDRHHQGYIELSELEKLMRAPTVHKYDHSQQLMMTQPPRRRSRWQHYSRKYKLYLHDYWIRIWLLALWVGAMASLFTWKFFQYKNREAYEVMGYCVCVAKGAAETLKLNMALILLPVCRNTITYLRSTWLGSIVPFDDNIKFHKTVAAGIGVGVAVHAMTHLACDFPKMIAKADHPYMVHLSNAWFGGKPPTYGVVLQTKVVVTGIVMVVLMSIAFFLASYWCRKSIVKLPFPFHRLTGFNAFWYSHHLFVVVYVLVIVHGWYLFLTTSWSQKTTWMYILVPLTLYLGERVLRTFRATTYKVNTIEASIYPGDVLAIHMSKPAGFKYQSGMYIFLQCPCISPFEWHPFSITSAPGDDYLSVHMRSVGDWTNELKRVFQVALESSGSDEDFSVNSRFPKLCIDGPYGAPAQDFRKYDVLLLVGLGIGATPFISILKNMLNDIKSADAVNSTSPDNNPSSVPHDMLRACDSPRWPWDVQSPKRPSDSPARRKKQKVRVTTNAYFYWVTREQGSFEWFKGVMNEISTIDHKAVIEMHNYLTSVYEEGDARSALITMVQALHHAKSGVDILSGTRARTHFARPNWSAVFSRLARTHPNARIGVFYCGAPKVASELDALSRRFTQQTSTKFEFHKENF